MERKKDGGYSKRAWAGERREEREREREREREKEFERRSLREGENQIVHFEEDLIVLHNDFHH